MEVIKITELLTWNIGVHNIMINFDELRKIAEHHIGQEGVRRIENELKQHQKGPKDLVSASRVTFNNEDDNPRRSNNHSSRAKAKRESYEKSNDTTLGDTATSFIKRSEGSASERILMRAIRGEYFYAIAGLLLGLAAIIGGVLLGINGVGGSTSWTAKLLGMESYINDAAPGVVLFVVGIFFVLITRPRVKLKDLKG